MTTEATAPSTPAKHGLRELLPHLVCIVSLTLLYRTWLVGGALLVGLVVGLAYLRANAPTFIWQFIYALGSGAAAYALARTLDGRLPVEACALFLGAAIGRLPLAAPAWKGRIDFALLAFAMVAIGGSREPSKDTYAAASVALALALAWSAGDASPLRLIKDHPWAAALVLLLGASLAGALAWVTPHMTSNRFLMGYGMSRTGFSNRVVLGGPSGMETSDVIVMRIRGGHPDYLRGSVMDSFERGESWGVSRQKVIFTGAGKGAITVSSSKPTMHLFAPLGGVGISDGAVQNSYGVATVAAGISDYTIDPKGGTMTDPPDAKDTEIPEALRKRMVPVAEQIVGDEKDDAKRLLLLTSYLSANYRYSLSRTRAQKDHSAIMDFLLVNKEGHCEYFASALALLARALGIPSRVVAGYRVVEENPYGHYDVVRERHAHAWVEIWDRAKGRWRTIDPTPPTEAMTPRAVSDASAAFDAGREKLAMFGQMLAEQPAWLLGTLGLLSAFLLSRRLLRRGKRRAKVADVEAHRMFADVSEALAKLGLAREPWEGIEAFAERVREAGRTNAADVLVHYAQVRYDPEAEKTVDALEVELTELLATLRSSRTAALN